MFAMNGDAVTPREIKLLLVMHDVNLAEVARDIDVSRSMVSQVARLKKRSPRVERALAERLGRSVETLFGPRRSRSVHTSTVDDISKAG